MKTENTDFVTPDFLTTDFVTPAKGMVIWLTGLSGAGKTTLARAVRQELLQTGGAVELLDGDEVRENLSHGLGFSKEDRDRNVSRIGFVARLLARNGVRVLVSAISPYRQSRDDARRSIESNGVRFLEVYVRCSLEVLIDRDVKGLYKKALAGEVRHFTGISDAYEAPLSPDCIVDSSTESIEQSLSEILSRIELSQVEARVSPRAAVTLKQSEAVL